MPQKTILKNRKIIRKGILEHSSCINNTKIKKISLSDLEILFIYYDALFFASYFKNTFKGKFEFTLSKRMTRSAGITKCPKNHTSLKPEEVRITISIGVDFFFQYDHLDGSKKVCGIETFNSLEALQIVFEHELCHAWEFIEYGNSNCKAQRFKEISYNLFRHSENHHQIPTNRQIASKKLGINIGDTVCFVLDNKKLDGIVVNINKRATIMVKNSRGGFRDKKGTRFIKYYVPLSLLQKIN